MVCTYILTCIVYYIELLSVNIHYWAWGRIYRIICINGGLNFFGIHNVPMSILAKKRNVVGFYFDRHVCWHCKPEIWKYLSV